MNSPAIRFAGFTEDWDVCVAANILKTTADKGHPELPVLAATQDRGMILREDTGINIAHDKKNEATYKRVIPGQFVIHLRSFQGGFAHSNVEGITSPAYTVLGFIEKEKHYDWFWKYIFNAERFVKRLETVTYGIRDGRSISYDDFSEITFQYPSFGEQKRIGDVFVTLDRLINLHRREHDKTVNIKKALLEKMFPKAGEDKPEIRFAGFTDAWEQWKLGELVEFFSGLTYSPHNVVSDGTLVLRSSNVKGGAIINADNVFVEAECVNVSNVQVGDIVVVVRNGSRNLIGKHALIKRSMPNTVIGAFMTGLRCHIPEFTNALLDTHHFDNEIKKNLGATINQITTGEFKKMTFFVPEQSEQKKIGRIFTLLDNLITLHKRELTKLQNIKKALLEKMFV